MLDFPEATYPTMATISPGFTLKLRFLRISRFFNDCSSIGLSLLKSSSPSVFVFSSGFLAAPYFIKAFPCSLWTAAA